MTILHKNILLAVTGSIAAYKAAHLVRLLVKAGAHVRVILTPGAKDFVTPLTFSTLSKNEVYSDFYNVHSGQWHNHVELALWADVLLIAPATANEIAKMAHGLCDNLLTAVYLSAKCPVVLAPAMDLDMYTHPATQQNFNILLNHGAHIIESETGELASGLYGQGRMAEPENILTYLQNFFTSHSVLKNKNILITAGPTREPIDPVRFISNHSTGKMGLALAKDCAKRGANVILIAGTIEVNLPGIVQVTHVHTAEQMYQACSQYFNTTDIAIFTAAVADYRPKYQSPEKIKKLSDSFTFEMIKNPDIALEFGKIKKQKQISIGFALETENEQQNAMQKLKNKNFDMLVLNSTKNEGAGFGFDTNQVTIFHKNGTITEYGLKPKHQVANDILNQLEQLLNEQ